MARFWMLATDDMLNCVPHNVTVETIAEDVGLYVEGSDLPNYVYGTSVLVEGDEEGIRSWLAPFSPVWKGHGSIPQLEQFEVMHVRQDPL